MKNKIITVMMLAAILGLLSGCGSDGAYLKDVKAEKYVELGEYKGIEVSIAKPEVTDEYLDMYIDYFMEESASLEVVTGRNVQNGDVVNLDYEGKVDGVAFDGGTAQGASLEIGSGSFIDGFESGMVGMEIGETRDINVTFPENYSEDLGGADAVFTVTVNSISIYDIPELNDEYVQSLGIAECSTVEDFRQYVYDMMYESGMSEYEAMLQESIVQSAMQNCVFKEVPEAMVARMEESMMSNLTQEAAMYNMDLTSYISQYYGMTADTAEEEVYNQSVTMIKRYLMLQAIADKEGWNVSKEEIESQMETLATSNGYESVEAFGEVIDTEAYGEYIMSQNVIKNLVEYAVVPE